MRHNFRELKIWKTAMIISREVYEISRELPKSEKYSLRDQMTRSSISIASNIAEGSGRTTQKEFSRFLDISISSSFELETQLILTGDLFPIEIDSTLIKINELQRMIRGFQHSLKTKSLV